MTIPNAALRGLAPVPDMQLPRDMLPLSRRVLVMGILNVTPDSFSDGGLFFDAGAAVAQGMRLIEEGADIVDVGGESSRPGSEPVPVGEEIRRVGPVVEALSPRCVVSVDTTKAAVAAAALDAGAQIVNDISAGRFDPEMLPLVAERRAGIVLMHMLGTPATMQADPQYSNVVEEVARFLDERADAATAAGVGRERILVDPGFGFGKRLEHNLALLAHLARFRRGGLGVAAGTSRKSFIGAALGGLPADQRLEGTAATVALAVTQGANVVRVHDVRAMVRVVRMTEAVLGA